MLSFRLCAMTHQIRRRARYAIVDIAIVLALSIRSILQPFAKITHHLTCVLLQVQNRLCVRSAIDPLCAKHDVYGSCFNSVAVDPSSINSGQKIGEACYRRRLFHMCRSCVSPNLTLLWPGFVVQNPRLALAFNISS